jgi:putative ABC transport system permease protein
MLILKIAWRNLWRHRGQSLVVGVILCLGALILTVGNGVVSGMEQGLRRTIVQAFTGDLVVIPADHEGDNVFLEMMGKTLSTLGNYNGIDSTLLKNARVEATLPIGKNMAMLLNDEDAAPSFLYLVGADFVRYRKMFPGNMSVIEGVYPASGRPGLLLPVSQRKEIRDQSNIRFVAVGSPGARDSTARSSMVLMGFNQDNSSTDIRLDVNGVFRYKALNTIFGSFVLTDIESYREALGYTRASESNTSVVSARDSALFSGSENLDALFSTDSLIVPGGGPTASATVALVESTGILVGHAPASRNPVDLDQGAYNLVLVRLHSGADAGKALSELNAGFRQAGIPARAVTWQQSLGPVGSLTGLIKIALYAFVAFLFLVAVIIIVNTLNMAVLERMPEIGMMRAIGARKAFIGWMFMAETAVLAFVFGGLGILLGSGAVVLLARLNLASDNDILQLLFGGDTFHPLIAGWDLLVAAGQLAMVTLAATAYPLIVARGVTPLDAVYKE